MPIHVLPDSVPARRTARVMAFLGMLVTTLSLGGGQASRRPEQGGAIAHLRSLQPIASRTEVLVLATFHLNQIKENFKPSMLDHLVSRLVDFKPDCICIETLPGTRVSELELRRNAGPLYAEVLDVFATRHLKLGKRAQEILGTTQPAAAAKVRELLRSTTSKGPERTAVEDRAALALWMLAAYEPDSAALQWSYLGKTEREGRKEVPNDLAGALEVESAKVNEVPTIAARLARRLGLEELHPVDDFEDLESYTALMSQLEKDIQESPLLASAPKAAVYIEATSRLEECVRQGELFPQFAYLNSPAYAAADVDAQWGVYLRTRFPSGTDRGRLGLWENRNMKIAARIKAVAARHPGGRILVIYGAAHKPFIEAYLGQTADIQLVALNEVTS